MTDWRRRPWTKAGRPRKTPKRSEAPTELNLPPTPPIINDRAGLFRSPPAGASTLLCPGCGTELAGMLTNRERPGARVGQCTRCAGVLRFHPDARGHRLELVADESTLTPDEAKSLAYLRRIFPGGGTTVTLMRCPSCRAIVRELDAIGPPADRPGLTPVGICGGCGEAIVVRGGECVKYDGPLGEADVELLRSVREIIAGRKPT